MEDSLEIREVSSVILYTLLLYYPLNRLDQDVILLKDGKKTPTNLNAFKYLQKRAEIEFNHYLSSFNKGKAWSLTRQNSMYRY
jgi:hypothetical protein